MKYVLYLFLYFISVNSFPIGDTPTLSPYDKEIIKIQRELRFMCDPVGALMSLLAQERLDLEEKVAHIGELNKDLAILKEEYKCVVFYIALRNRMDEIERDVMLRFPWLEDIKDKYKRWHIIIFFIDDLRIRAIVRRLLDYDVDPSVFFTTVQAVYKIECEFVHEKTQLDIYNEDELDLIMDKLRVNDNHKRSVIKSIALPIDKKTEELLKLNPVTYSDLDKFESFTLKNPKLKITNIPTKAGDVTVSVETIKNFLLPGIPDSVELYGNHAVATFSNVRKLVKSFYHGESRYIGNTLPKLRIEF